jgi:hypothetical protein
MRNDFKIRGNNLQVTRDGESVRLQINGQWIRTTYHVSPSEAFEVEHGMKIVLLELESLIGTEADGRADWETVTK